ncbi:MAG TPA: GNAT family N-acetyltransferase [Gemmatimonadaceae bacterium]|nr:GNAT family N-acetyltransferase [Gemmatimonadaceae bacterium]
MYARTASRSPLLLNRNAITIDRVGPASDDIVSELAALLVDAVTGGASVSFMAGLRFDEAAEWWRKTFSASSPKTVVLVARDEQGIVGTVQLQPSWAPNQPHRADVAKLIVHQRARRRGVAHALMQELERHAQEQGFTLLLLDTCKGSPAEKLYSSLGWIRVGEVPRFALNPDGTPCDTVFFYKELRAPRPTRR